MKFVNLCPHAVDIVDEGNLVLTIPPSGEVARCEQKDEFCFCINNVNNTRETDSDKAHIEVTATGRPIIKVPVFKTTYGKITGLPDPEVGKVFIVSRIVKLACPERDDVLTPNGIIRDDEGRIIGGKCLSL